MSRSLISRTSLLFSVLALCAWGDLKEARWISTSPQITELLFQLGKGHVLVGTTDQSFYPASAKQLPKIGLLFYPNLEAVFAQRPRGVFWDSSSENSIMKHQLASLGIQSLNLELNSVNGIFDSIKKIEKELGECEHSFEKMESERLWRFLSEKERPFSFVAMAWADPPILFGEKTFFFNLIEGMGGRGILPRVWKSSFPKVSEEWLLSQNPDVLIFLKHDENTAQEFRRKCKKWWPQKGPRCVGVSAEYFARASLTPLLHLNELKSALELTP